MVSLSEVEKGTGAVNALIEHIIKLFRTVRDTTFRAKVDELIISLRSVYFFDSGVLSVLVQIKSGIEPDEKLVRRFAEEFKDAPEEVKQALINLNSDTNFKETKLPGPVIKALDNIGYGKLRIRQQIGAFLTQYQNGPKDQSDIAAALIETVQQINARVDEVELLLKTTKST